MQRQGTWRREVRESSVERRARDWRIKGEAGYVWVGFQTFDYIRSIS
jgi:hypothetical protein